MSTTVEDFLRLRDRSALIATDELDTLWGELHTVSVPEMLGNWRGGDFLTGHKLHDALISNRWHGKRFSEPNRAQPLICRDETGQLFSNRDLGYGGEASLWNIEFRGEVTATMVYDKAPIFDHFKRIDADTVMGIMNGNPKYVLDHGRHYYFYLTRETDLS